MQKRIRDVQRIAYPVLDWLHKHYPLTEAVGYRVHSKLQDLCKPPFWVDDKLPSEVVLPWLMDHVKWMADFAKDPEDWEWNYEEQHLDDIPAHRRELHQEEEDDEENEEDEYDGDEYD